LIIPLHEIVVDERARDGTWCRLPYPGHPDGCPKYPECIKVRPHIDEYEDYEWYGVVRKYALNAHAEEMKELHSDWSESQCRNDQEWQDKILSELKKEADVFADEIAGDVVLERPEGHGVDMWATMAGNGINLETNDPDVIHKIVLVGKRKAGA
jgi:hypothetical protein